MTTAKIDTSVTCVYVETNYDTDADASGTCDALVQLPRPPWEGDIEAEPPFIARGPIFTVCTSGEAPMGKDGMP